MNAGRRLVATAVGRVPAERKPIRAGRVVLEPITQALARRLVTGDLSGVRPGSGWPLPSDLPGAPNWPAQVRYDVEVHWLVLLDGEAIGDCFTHGGADERGDIEIGYALAAPYRGQGYGTELVRALCGWLLEHAEIERVVARGVDAANAGSRRVLERTGFELEADAGATVSYALRRASFDPDGARESLAPPP